MGFKVWGLRFRLQCLGLRFRVGVQGLGFGAAGCTWVWMVFDEFRLDGFRLDGFR